MDELRHLVHAPLLTWIPQVTLLFLLGYQPWRNVRNDGTLADLAGVICNLLIVTGLFVSPLATEPLFWLALTATYVTWIGLAYFVADNHHYLIGYWCVSMAIALTADGARGEALLARDAGLLTGLCFLFAAASKLSSRRYRDGSFFTQTLISDPRFLLIATYVAGVTDEERRHHAQAWNRVTSAVSAREEAFVPVRLRKTALALTWWTVGTEAIVALMFLIPIEAVVKFRVATLIVFVVTTFTFVRVPAFGQILLIMLLVIAGSEPIRVPLILFAASLTVISYLPSLTNRVIRYKQFLTRLSLVNQRAA